jgi:hypothetical protein
VAFSTTPGSASVARARRRAARAGVGDVAERRGHEATEARVVAAERRGERVGRVGADPVEREHRVDDLLGVLRGEVGQEVRDGQLADELEPHARVDAAVELAAQRLVHDAADLLGIDLTLARRGPRLVPEVGHQPLVLALLGQHAEEVLLVPGPKDGVDLLVARIALHVLAQLRQPLLVIARLVGLEGLLQKRLVGTGRGARPCEDRCEPHDHRRGTKARRLHRSPPFGGRAGCPPPHPS